MRNRNWCILGLALLTSIIYGCGRPNTPVATQVKPASAPAAKDDAQGWTAYPPAEGEKNETIVEENKKSLSKLESGSAQNKVIGDEAKSEDSAPERDKLYRNHLGEDLPSTAPAGATSAPISSATPLSRKASAPGDSGLGGPGGMAGIGGGGRGMLGGPPSGGSAVAGSGFGIGDGQGLGERPEFENESGLRENNGKFVPGGEAYEKIAEKKFARVLEEPLSTFSIDVDTASYANVRRFLTQRALPPVDAVRIEELVNYFSYDYAPPTDDKPFASSAEVAGCPWNPQHRLVRIGLKGKVMEDDARPVSNLVFLIDVSGSMQGENRLPLVKHSLRMLTEKLGENDRVAMVVYAGSSGLVLDSTSGTEKEKILGALDNLQAGGSTNGASGIQQAYEVAVSHFIKGGVNRVILCTDGDFNVGVTDRNQLTSIIEQNAKTGVFLSVLGFGMGNLKDATMEQLADKGNGNYAYIDTPLEAKKVLVEQMSGTLVTIAKDVKIQVEFNPAKAAAYRLVGYENRMLAAQDFTDDKKDAGEIGAGHTVTALYEVIPAGLPVPGATPDLKYQKPTTTASPNTEVSDELLTVKLRYKKPDGDVSTELSFPLKDEGNGFGKASADFRWATSVAAFGMLLRDSASKGDMTLEAVKEWAQTAVGADKNGYRREFMTLIDSALSLQGANHLSDSRK